MRRPSVFRSLKVAKHSGGGREPRAVSDGTTLLFGLPGVQVERVERRPDGTRVVHVATADETAAAYQAAIRLFEGPDPGRPETTCG